MPKAQVSITPLLASLSQLEEKVLNAELPRGHEWERKRALKLVGAIRDVFEAFCLSQPSGETFFQSPFPSKPPRRKK